MRKFQRKRGMITTKLSAYEVELLASLIMQLVELVTDGEPEDFAVPSASGDPFEQLVQDLEAEPDEPEVSEDPVLKRLFPNAYPNDPSASSDFRSPEMVSWSPWVTVIWMSSSFRPGIWASA